MRLLEHLRRAFEAGRDRGRQQLIGDLLTCDVAAPSDTPGRRPNEIDTDGSWPEWLIDCGPTVSLKSTTDSSGTSAPLLRLERDLPQRIGLLLVARIELEQHAILARSRRRSWTTTSGRSRSYSAVSIWRGVQADRRRLVAIDDQVDPRALHLHVVRDVLHLRHLRHRRFELRRPA